jgi:opacity protein-like surface antigen
MLLPFSDWELLDNSTSPTLSCAEVDGLSKPPSLWQLHFETGLSFRPETGIAPNYTYGTFYARAGLTYAINTRLRTGFSVGYNNLHYLFRSDNEPFSEVTFSERIPDPINSSDNTIIRANYRSVHEWILQLNAEFAYRLWPRISVEGGAGIGRTSYQQEASFSDNIPLDDPIRTGVQPAVLRRYTTTAHGAVRYDFSHRWSLVARANLAFRDLSPDAIHSFSESETATGYQLGVRFGL